MEMRGPLKGWNSWNTFGANINDALIRESAEAVAKSGLKDAGYDYIVIDDCWSLKDRDADGRLVADPALFPHGMKDLADYIHSLGFKFGMYSCVGTKTLSLIHILLGEAVAISAEAKALHDKMEQFNIAAMDWQQAEDITRSTATLFAAAALGAAEA